MPIDTYRHLSTPIDTYLTPIRNLSETYPKLLTLVDTPLHDVMLCLVTEL